MKLLSILAANQIAHARAQIKTFNFRIQHCQSQLRDIFLCTEISRNNCRASI